MASEKKQVTDTTLSEIAEAEKWFNNKFRDQLTQEQIQKLILHKLHKIEAQNVRINNIL